MMLKKVKDQCLDERREADRQKNIAARLRLEAKESIIAWSEQQKGFVECIKKAELENNAAREECKTFKESLKEAEEANNKSKEEIQKIRDIMRQALNEANVAKAAASAAKEEISQLKDALAQKEEALKLLNQENERPARSKACARTKSPARRTALMTMKQYSEMEDSEQGKEHTDHDKESKQPTLRPSPLPVLRRTALLTMRQHSEFENSENGMEHNDHDHEGEHPTLPKRPPSPLPVARRAALLTMRQYPEMENSEQGKEHNDYDKEAEHPTLGPKRPPSPIPTMRKAMLMTIKHYKEHNDHYKESEQSAIRPSRSPLVLPAITTKVRMSASMTNLKLCSEMEDSQQGKKQKPMNSTHHDKEHNDHDKESEQSAPRPSRSTPVLPATMTKLCSEMEDNEHGKKQKPMDSTTHHDKERKNMIKKANNMHPDHQDHHHRCQQQ
ncbi:nucleolar and coiled-body phosphoprotein 1-like [Hibiscus syriacus]|uniref:nucleolar and coiled-body phosphoprotein 1-like n=1 Tax=Hibiscus syriacus TaxID=106335 RepID=UPI001922EC4A|nr:nucleolar and coiled-body phosphoprotein 1-like [Hibiscus syriacus]